MFRTFYKIILWVLITVSVSFAQAGRISGKITDGKTGESLVGANVIIMGTTYGAATDINGDYIIRQVPAGTYNVRASYIGYKSVLIKGINVVSGLTTGQDFTLSESELTTQEIVVQSKKPLIQKSATNAIRVVGAEDIKSLPIRNIADIVALQPGVVQLNGTTYIRGSRANGTGYLLEGADVKSILGSGSIVTTTPDALQEITTQAGGYTAEFGNANAGVISQDFKTGTNKYHFSLRSENDNFGNFSNHDKFLGTYSYGYSDNVITFSGPVLTKKLKIFLSGENRFIRDHTPHFFDGNPTAYSDGALFDTTKVYDSGFYGGSTSEGEFLKWNSGAIPARFSNRYTLNGTLLFDSNPLFIRLAGAASWSRTQNNTPDVQSIFNLGRIPLRDNSSLLLNLKTTYLISAKSFIVANVNFYDARGKSYDPIFEDNYMLYSDSLAASDNGYKYVSYTNGPRTYDFYGFPFDRPGILLSGYAKDHNNYLGGSVAYTTQWKKHAFKAGGSFQRWTIRHFAVGGASNILQTIRTNPDLAANSDSLRGLIGNQLFRSWNNYGYDVFGNEVSSGTFDAKHPVFASAYLEDRLEVSDLILNLGLRYDYFDMDSWKWANPKLPSVNNQTHLLNESSLISGSTFQYVSPRVGFSFPVTDRTVFHLQYGKFVQAPSLSIAYRGVYQAAQILTATNLFTNPIAYDPQPIRTTQYEIGFSQQFSDNIALDVTAFYKDIKGQIQYTEIFTDPGAARSKYASYVNQDFSTTKGLELSLKIRRTNRVRAQINYTYSSAEGTNSFTGSGIGALEVSNQAPTVISPLNYNFTHAGSMMLDYRFGKNDGGPILEQLGINLLFTFNSGHPFTFAQDLGLGQASPWTGGLIPSADSRGRRPIGPVNSSTTPWNYNLDLRIDKTVEIYKFDVNFYVYVRNLLNTRNVTNVYQKTGNAYNDGFLESPAGQQIISGSRYTERFADLYRSLNLGNREAAFTQYGYDLFSTPRQIRAGVSINF